MFTAIIVPAYYDINYIPNKVTIYLPNNKYTVCILSEDNITNNLKDQIVPVLIETGLVEPVRAYQRYYSTIEDMYRPIINRKLMAFKSKLIYAVSENLASDELYVKLENPMNEDETRRYFNYRLYYNEIPCYTFKSDDLLDNFIKITKQNFGPLILSSHALNVEGVPHWYSKEIFRDMIELGEYKMKDRILVEGSNTKDLYLFYQEETNLTDDMVNKIIKDIRGRIISAIKLKIFPRNTPQEFIKNKRLISMPNGQFSINYIVPDDINVYSETMQLYFELNNLDELFMFLNWMMMLPTWGFIEQELKISLISDKIEIRYITKYLPDYIRVNSAKRISSVSTDQVKIIYPNRNSDYKNGITFFDYGNNEKALLVKSDFNLEYITPKDYTLDTRIMNDPNIV